MKKNKTYLLLFAVLVIWSIIGSQMYRRLNPSIPALEKVQLKSTFVKEEAIATSFYAIQPTYRDPFLGKYPQKKKKVIKKKIVKPKSTIPFPNVVYNGMIKGNVSQSYILTINGRQEIVKLGQATQRVTLIKATMKEAVVKFEGEIKTIVSIQSQ